MGPAPSFGVFSAFGQAPPPPTQSAVDASNEGWRWIWFIAGAGGAVAVWYYYLKPRRRR